MAVFIGLYLGKLVEIHTVKWNIKLGYLYIDYITFLWVKKYSLYNFKNLTCMSSWKKLIKKINKLYHRWSGENQLKKHLNICPWLLAT